MDELRINLAKAHEHALATSGGKKAATLMLYGPSTLQTALADTIDDLHNPGTSTRGGKKFLVLRTYMFHYGRDE